MQEIGHAWRRPSHRESSETVAVRLCGVFRLQSRRRKSSALHVRNFTANLSSICLVIMNMHRPARFQLCDMTYDICVLGLLTGASILS